jgi:hypothetical protein
MQAIPHGFPFLQNQLASHAANGTVSESSNAATIILIRIVLSSNYRVYQIHNRKKILQATQVALSIPAIMLSNPFFKLDCVHFDRFWALSLWLSE